MNFKESAKKLKQNIPVIFLVLKGKTTPVPGYLDDVILLPALIALTIRLIPKEIWEHNRALAGDMWKKEKPKKWYFAIPVIMIWAGLIWLIVRAVK